MADPASRKSATLNRLRSQLRRKRESLAEQFDFKMYFAVVFKDKIQESITHTLHHSKARLGHSKNFFSLKDAHVKIVPIIPGIHESKKKSALFEVAEVIPVMTNNYEDSILKGVQEEVYSLESSQQLLEKDIVQLHAPRYQCLRKDVIGCVQEIDFFLWPRNDIDRIVCLLFSRWKGEEHSDYRLIQGKFDFESHDYEKQLLRLLTRKEGTGLILSNPSQSLFLFVDKHNLQTEKGEVAVFKMSSFCLHVPQNQLTHWGSELRDDVLAPFMPD